MNAISSLKVGIDMHPKVTKHIKEIIDFVSHLIEKGHAYTSPSGSVYFDVTTYPPYGELSNTKDGGMGSGRGVPKGEETSL